jgi:uncharacterized protein YdiU (UPF0061 family)
MLDGHAIDGSTWSFIRSGEPVTTPAPPLDNSYARLPDRFYTQQAPVPVVAPRLIRLNRDLARELGFDPDGRSDDDWAAVFSGNKLLDGTTPLAMAYAGHQFGQFVPQLGDGRAILLGEVVDDRGKRRDVQLKGAGRTRFSRQGDGRSALGPVLREYVVSEAMHTLGVPTTRALAAVSTGETVVREAMLPGAILTRVAASHVRVGTFQYFAARDDSPGVQALADYVIDRHYPELTGEALPYLALLEAVTARQAALVAKWLAVGFVHGVMNTDNVSIAGETIDFGPCAFVDEYDPDTVFSSIDHLGRYAYQRQPQIAQWNMARFAETLLGLIDADQERAIALATEKVNGFQAAFEAHRLTEMGTKLGLDNPCVADGPLIDALLEMMQAARADYTLTFRRLADAADDGFVSDPLAPMLSRSPDLDVWLASWRDRLEHQETPLVQVTTRMRRVNPIYIPRNHLVERVIRAAVDDDDHHPFEQLCEVLAQPFDERPDQDTFARPPEPHERVLQTFCGT